MAKENSKETIIREALKLFAEKGFAAVSMRDLAEAVGISASTIYHYYDSKQALFRDMIREAVNTEIRLIIFFAAKEGEDLYSQQKQDLELTVAQIISSLLQNSGLN